MLYRVNKVAYFVKSFIPVNAVSYKWASKVAGTLSIYYKWYLIRGSLNQYRVILNSWYKIEGVRNFSERTFP